MSARAFRSRKPRKDFKSLPVSVLTSAKSCHLSADSTPDGWWSRVCELGVSYDWPVVLEWAGEVKLLKVDARRWNTICLNFLDTYTGVGWWLKLSDFLIHRVIQATAAKSSATNVTKVCDCRGRLHPPRVDCWRRLDSLVPTGVQFNQFDNQKPDENETDDEYVVLLDGAAQLNGECVMGMGQPARFVISACNHSLMDET